MAHELENMFYYGETPWHGLGVQVDGPLTAEEAIKMGGLDWEVAGYPVFSVRGDEIPSYQAITREDNSRVLSIMKKRYTPVQNRDAFSFFDAVTQGGYAKYHTAGSLREGARIWMLAKLPGELVITKEDTVDKYVLLTNSHDGSSAVIMQWTPVRVVCMNTLNLALGQVQVGERFYARHTTNVQHKIAEAQNILAIGNRFYENFQRAAQGLVTLALPAPTMEQYLAHILEIDDKYIEELRRPKRFAYESILELAEAGRGQTSATRGTGWGLFNAVAEYADYVLVPRKGNNRLQSAWFGSGAQLKQRAWDVLTGETKEIGGE